MTREQLRSLPRRRPDEVLALVEGGPGYHQRIVLAVEAYTNEEWWRGYFAGVDLGNSLNAELRSRNPLMHSEDCPSHDGDDCTCGAMP